MAYWSTPKARGFLRDAKNSAGTSGIQARLEGWSHGVGLDLLQGGQRTSQTAESLSLTWGIIAGLPRDQFFDLINGLIDRWESAWSYLQQTTGKDPLDYDVYQLMMCKDPTNPIYNQNHALTACKGWLPNFNMLIK